MIDYNDIDDTLWQEHEDEYAIDRMWEYEEDDNELDKE